MKSTDLGARSPGPKVRLHHLLAPTWWASCVTLGRIGMPLNPIFLNCETGIITEFTLLLGGQVRETVFASCPRPASQHLWGGHWHRYTSVSPYTPLGMFQQMKDTLKMHYDLFLTVSHFVPVLLSSFCCSGFQKIIPLPKLIE